ncbi:MAG: glucokinase [Gammaproteobacteria bacterium]|nr:glucokinase [Gammaproteobacteria bacterium]
MSLLLSADVGGTKTILQLSKLESGALSAVKQNEYKSADWPTFDALLDDFLHGQDTCDSACFAIAGPIQVISDEPQTNTIVNVTNLPWLLNLNDLKEKYQFTYLSLINDFQAIAYSVELLGENELLTLQAGQPSNHGPRAFIGAGTGLGQAISTFNGLDYDVISTEGGHCDFAPNNDFEVALYQFLNQKYTHVSYERLLSGEGLYNIYQFFTQICDLDSDAISEKNLIESSADKAMSISHQAEKNAEGLAARSMALFFQIYGSQTGNLALSCLPSGGIYIAGGIAQKNIELLKSSDFMRRFLAKGRMQILLEQIPVHIITSKNAGLLGATSVAFKHMQKH